jgi:hypothetical protein
MSYTVELRYIDGDLGDLLCQMQAWLERNRIEMAELHHSSGPPGLAFRIQFRDHNQATAFAEAFRGRIVECADPQSAGPCWVIPPSPRHTRRPVHSEVGRGSRKEKAFAASQATPRSREHS